MTDDDGDHEILSHLWQKSSARICFDDDVDGDDDDNDYEDDNR